MSRALPSQPALHYPGFLAARICCGESNLRALTATSNRSTAPTTLAGAVEAGVSIPFIPGNKCRLMAKPANLHPVGHGRPHPHLQNYCVASPWTAGGTGPRDRARAATGTKGQCTPGWTRVVELPTDMETKLGRYLRVVETGKVDETEATMTLRVETNRTSHRAHRTNMEISCILCVHMASSCIWVGRQDPRYLGASCDMPH